jgi:hypothetical protein
MTTVYVGKKEQVVADYHIGEVKGLERVLKDLQLFDETEPRGEIQ